jgi:uncharacterized protein (DUF1800 family)
MQVPVYLRVAAAFSFLSLFCTAQGPPAGMSASTAAGILEQATWGPTQASITELQTEGFDLWFANQLKAPITSYPTQPSINSLGKTNTDIRPIQVQFFENALNNPDQLRQRVAFALSEIWVVSHIGVVNADALSPLLNIFQNDAFSTYPQLMRNVTLNPAMGHYLDMVNNRKAIIVNGQTVSSPNENYARELMQLFTLGVNNLDMSGNISTPTPTYGPGAVSTLAAALTGWTYAPKQAGQLINYADPMVPVESRHDTSQKVFTLTYPNNQEVSVTLPKGQTAEKDLDGVLAAVFADPTLPPFISRQLIQHLVTSNPSADYINRVSTVFTTSGGDLKTVIYAILTDSEARLGDTSLTADPASFGHYREPVLLLANLLRGLNGQVFDSTAIFNTSANLGQNLFNPPSVFSYFSPQSRVAGGLYGPEFQIESTQTSVIRANTIYSALYNGQLDPGTLFDITPFVNAASTSLANLTGAINTLFFHGTMSGSVQNAIKTAVAEGTTPAAKAKAALYVALTSNEFQVIH